MATSSFLQQLTEFYRAARHLWGRCPKCGRLFRLSDAAISFGAEPPRDWLQGLQLLKEGLRAKAQDARQWQAELERRDIDLTRRERDLALRERSPEAEAQARARDMLKDKETIRGLPKQARYEGAHRSRSVLLGSLFERLAPFLQRFQHDPRDVRPLFNPVDYVCFDGLTANRRVERITFVEVKSGTSTVSPTQRSIADAIRDGRVSAEVWQFGKRGIPLQQQLLPPTRAREALPPG
jgi:predicted Holliday junction resolvase-like endonuclease